MAEKVKLEVFTAEPPCPGCSKLLELADRMKDEYGEELQVVKHIGPCDEFEKYRLTVVPAVVVAEKIRLMGVCPSEKTIKAALWEAGL
ncbi:Thioredoxin domain protein [Candidatus Methanoperedenaceae archaeon GB50]|nr:Thioredoxin domain protein [Candidatus Methanoperedenaceae archaeon GB50]CAD7781284.1 MAG: Thioredoxin domain protein [Candidatus Methanoperedenaceae archaeon GB50]